MSLKQLLKAIATIYLSFYLFFCTDGKNSTKQESDTKTAKPSETLSTATSLRKGSKANLEVPLTALILNDMVLWEKFDFEKYVLKNGFEFESSSNKIKYLLDDKALGFPETQIDSVFFVKKSGADIISISRTAKRKYNYTDQQRLDIYNYSGDPNLYSDPYNAKKVTESSSKVDISYEASSGILIIPFIKEIESLGCTFMKSIGKEIMENSLEKIIPEYERETDNIENTCECSPIAARKLSNTNIFQGIIKRDNKPVYYLDFSSGTRFK
jgi:hypothetical protein